MRVACGGYDDEESSLRRRIQADPSDIEAHRQLATIQSFRGDHAAAILALTELTHRFPRDTETRYELAMLQMMIEQDEHACEQLRGILALDPNHPRALAQTAFC